MNVFDGRKTAPTVLFVTLIAVLATTFALMPRHAFAEQQEERPLLMIVIGFEGEGEGAIPYSNVYNWSEALFSSGESLATYYREQSQGLLSLVPARETSAYKEKRNENRADRANDGIVHVKLDSTHHDWRRVNEGLSIKKDFDLTVLASFEAASKFVDFDDYDENGDGRIDSTELIVIVCTPGYDASGLNQAAQSNLPLLWPHSGTIDSSIDGLDNEKTLPSAYLAIAENFVRDGEDPSEAQQEPIGIIAHEIGHCLGLPDLYALNNAAEQGEWAAYKVGSLSLMARGAWARVLDEKRGWIFRPTSLDPWSLSELGWCEPVAIEGEGDYHLHSRGSEAGYNVLLIPTTDPNQYYLLENRQPESWDAALESAAASNGSHGGIVIWHVDAGVCERFGEDGRVNDTDHRPGVMPFFLERDGSGAFSSNWATTKPDLESPFFSTTSIVNHFGDADENIELPLYGSDETADAPAKRTSSGISIQVLSESGEDMIVRVKQTDDIGQATSSSTRKPPFALIVVLVALCVAGAAALALNEARRSSRRG